ncbi:NAD(P)-binding protein [Cryphonectria parasitica EP155]|uniref:NAD(P)-binding protein n=1 Tax=Cryphonectria parasitica (strain ATCC 38755 / EP155) TaxID=660469 RepID=A0A9P4YEF0_CRYP1|nr:NAD(P)-binding protein [Cryphonectria parasitica EP155]KAF3771371.1 NAD(P)-binding protein [Cryphonectria parasitica EP155]
MSESRSFQLGPPKKGPLGLFLHSQFCNKAVYPPSTTDLNGKTAIITGATAGLGSIACRQLLSFRLSRLILAVRSVKKGEDFAAQLRKDFPRATIDVWELEMGSYNSIQAFVRRVDTELTQLDIAVLNAGLGKLHFTINPNTGHEEVIQVNYLSTFLLAILLLPALKSKSPHGTPGRLTIVNSGVSYMAKFPNRNQVPLLGSFDDTKITPWDVSERYSVSKLLGHLFMLRLAGYINPEDVILNLVDPGYCKGSDLHRDATGIVAALISLSKSLAGRKLEDGASTYIDAAVVKGAETHGSFVMDWGIRPFAAPAHDPEMQPVISRLWDETMQEYEFAGAQRILNEMAGQK